MDNTENKENPVILEGHALAVKVSADVQELRSRWLAFEQKYLPVIEKHFAGQVATISNEAAQYMEKLAAAESGVAQSAIDKTANTASDSSENHG